MAGITKPTSQIVRSGLRLPLQDSNLDYRISISADGQGESLSFGAGELADIRYACAWPGSCAVLLTAARTSTDRASVRENREGITGRTAPVQEASRGFLTSTPTPPYPYQTIEESHIRTEHRSSSSLTASVGRIRSDGLTGARPQFPATSVAISSQWPSGRGTTASLSSPT